MATDLTSASQDAAAPRREFELCCETLQACEAATAGGADRIELCTALDTGGVTPPISLLRSVLQRTNLPVHVLIRPRAGSFHYTAEEFSLLLQQAADALAWGAAGIVTGVLREDGCIDIERMRGVLRVAESLPVTLHRAFDLTLEISRSLEEVIDLGCARILTSGGAGDVIEGLPALHDLTKQARGRIRIAAGGGVRLGNAHLLLKVPELDLHGSLRTSTFCGSAHPLAKALGGDYTVKAADVRAITDLVHKADTR